MSLLLGKRLGMVSQRSLSYMKAYKTRAPIASRSKIKRVTVAGTTGAIGRPIILALCKAGFEVQALSRDSRASSGLPISVRCVDYKNQKQLRSMLEGQDAVVSCLGDTRHAVSSQRALIDASLETGIKRFLPSEYGSDTSNPYVKGLPFFKAKVRHQDILKAAASKQKNFSFTILITGLFLDWCLSTVPCIINCGSRTAQIYDDGNIPLSVTRTDAVANAVASILSRPEETKNRILHIHEAVVTQNELIRRAQENQPSLPPFGRTIIDTAEYEAHAWRAYANPAAEALDFVIPFINLSIWSRGQPGHLKQVDNDLVDMEELKGTRRSVMIDNELRNAMQRFSDRYSKLKDAGMIDLGQLAYNEGKQRLVAC